MLIQQYPREVLITYLDKKVKALNERILNILLELEKEEDKKCLDQKN